VIDELCDRVADQKIAVACFYCDFQSQKMQTPENVLGALVKQIVRGLGAIPPEINAAFQKAKGQVGGRGLRVTESISLLKSALVPFDRVFICVDALDELLEKHLPKLLRSFHDISQSCPGVRFFFTGRPHIEVEIEKYFPGSAQFLQIEPKREDIMRYVEMMLDDDPSPGAMSANLRAEIMNRVSETISDVYVTAIFCSSLLTIFPRFLLVFLNIAAILDETTVYQRREQLKRMTNGRGLGDAYSATLDRIRGQGGGKSRLGMAALMWISRSEGPMGVDELCHALGVQIGSTNPNLDNIPSIQTLLASCLGLVAVDSEGSTVRLVHFTLQEYLHSHCEVFQNPYAVMAEVCLTYLNFNCIRELSLALRKAPQNYPFLEHASSCWGRYARKETTEGLKSLALQLLDKFDSHISAKLLLHPHADSPYWRVDELPRRFTGLHCVAYLGTDEIAKALLDAKNWDVNMTDCLGRTPLIWASKNGCEGVIKLLLERAGADVNIRDTMRDRVPLSWAVEYGQEGVAKLLLERDEVDLDSRDNSGRTTLSYAAAGGCEEILSLLLQRREVDPESQDKYGRTPLSFAVWHRREGAAKLLLERDEVYPESRDNFGRTVLSWAAAGGDERIVELLLERREVNPESRDINGQTPLSWAAENGQKGVAKLLLERDEVDPESRDNFGRTVLCYAAGAPCSDGGIKLLLERVEVNPESRDNDGRTPLSHAASGAAGDARVKLLLELEVVDPESRDNSGRTPLSYAAGAPTGAPAVKLFLEREEVNPESRDNAGRTPLSYAADTYEGEGSVRLLLEREEVDPDSRDNAGRTPLSHAAGAYDGEEAVKILLEREDVDPDSRDNDGRTPLSHAAGTDYGEERVGFLLEREDVDPDSRDNAGRTPLSYAAGALHGEGAVKLLLEGEEVDPDSRDNNGRTPLSHAAYMPWGQGAIKLLLEREEVDPESQDNDGRTPLYHASYVASIELLLERAEANPEIPKYFCPNTSSVPKGPGRW